MHRPFRATTFNVRYGTADDGPNSWPHRRELVRETLRRAAPDVIATQEALDFQIDYLSKQLDGHHVVGVGREDGARRGEFVAIFYRAERFSLDDHGHFWLSETPDIPGSKSWGTSQTRMVTWCRLQDRAAADAPITVFNTHFDQRSEQARTQSARLLRRRIERAALDSAVLVMGDFNATEDESVYSILRHRRDCALRLIDAYRAVHPERDGRERTHHGFRPETAGQRIDWILHSPDLETQEAGIDRTSFAGRFPSDHYPVTATLRFAFAADRPAAV